MIEDLRRILAARQRLEINATTQRLAAVMLLLLEEGRDYQVLFTRRTETLTHHKGQYSFPGGACHQSDCSLLDTALRETREEMGIAPDDVKVVGQLDDTMTFVSNFRITPFVGLLHWPYPVRPNPAEIAEVLTVPLAALREKASFREETHVDEGIAVTVPYYTYRGKVIWGATARILKQFLSLCPAQAL